MNNTTPTSIRLEKSLYEKIKKDAIRDKRSITQQISYMIEKYYEMTQIINK